SNTLHAPFEFDDGSNIVENPHIRMKSLSLSELTDVLKSRSQRPAANLTFALNYYLHGYDVTGYHLVNIAIHILAGLLLFLVAKNTLALAGDDKNSIVAPMFAGLLFLLAPVHTQAVTYIVQRMASMSAMLCMLSLFLYIKARLAQRENRKKRAALLFVLCVAAWLLGLGSKQTAAIMPVMVFLYEWYFFCCLDRGWLKRQAKWIVVCILLLLAVGAIYLGRSPIDKILAMYDKQTFTMGQRLLTEPRVVLLYLSLIFFGHPSRLNLDYDFPVSTSLFSPPTTIIAITGLFCLLAVAVFTAKKYRLFSFAILWFLGCLVIESSFLGLALVFEHRAYLPSMFLFVWLACFVLQKIKPQPVAVAILCATAALYGIWTFQRNALWADDVALWQDTVKKSPNSSRAYNNLGLALQNRNELEKAIAAYKKAVAINPYNIKAYNNIGLSLRDLGQPEKAVSFFKKALAIAPAYADAHYNIGLAFFDMGKMDLAKKAFERALEINPLCDKAWNNLGIIMMQSGKTEKAIKYQRRCLEINPLSAKAYNDLGNASLYAGLPEKAIRFFEKAVCMDPTYIDASKNLELVRDNIKRYGPVITILRQRAAKNPNDPMLCFQLGRFCQAAGMRDKDILQYEKAIAIKPDFKECLNSLGIMYATINDLAKAAQCYEKLAALLPDNPKVYYNLACLYARQNKKDMAVRNLKKALDAGYNDLEHIRADKDLDN
ncbi:MAG: hypothetical protein DRQ49_19740, partial [Gammaproteobacteria bacterium]